jgi:hypothetical protein
MCQASMSLAADTSVLSPQVCAGLIEERPEDGPPPSAILRLAVLATREGRASEWRSPAQEAQRSAIASPAETLLVP